MTSFSILHAFLFSMVLFIISMIFIHIKWKSIDSKKKKNLPPSPTRFPIIGNFHQVGSNPNRALQALSRKHGPIMLLHFGSLPTIVVSSAEVAQEMMKTHDLSFASRPSLPITNILLYGSKDIAFSPYGEYWRQLKSIAVVHLLSNARVKSYRKVRENEIGLMIQKLGESDGSLVDMGSLLSTLLLHIICKVSFGRTYDVSKLMDLSKKWLDLLTVFSVGGYIPWLSWIDRVSGLVGRAKDVAKEMDKFLERVVEDHANMKIDGRNDDGEDFVDILLDIHKDETTGFTLYSDSLKCVILDVFSGGTESTSSSLEWTLSELLRHPRIIKKLQQEVTEIAQGRSTIEEEDLEKMQYLKAVIKESLLMYPPLPLLVPHKSMQDVTIMGYEVPSQTQVIINAWAIGRDASKWEEPDEFRPERFLDKSINYKGINFEWLPFGAGRRGCPGIQFAVAIMELALANIVYKFDLALPDGVKCEDFDMSEICGITLHRKNSLMLKASPRF